MYLQCFIFLKPVYTTITNIFWTKSIFFPVSKEKHLLLGFKINCFTAAH